MKEMWKSVSFFITVLSFVLLAVYLSKQIDKWSGNSPKQSPIPVNSPSVVCPPDSLSYNNFIDDSPKNVLLIDTETQMFASGGKFINLQKVISKSETKESKVACGYLKVVAGTKDYGALQKWENVYINPNGFGGHIDSTNQIGLGDSREYSEYVFPLNRINYWKTRSDRARGNILEADWASLLNVSDTVMFEIALNSENTTGFIKEVSIKYKCWNPANGLENNECSLSVSNGKTTESSTPVK